MPRGSWLPAMGEASGRGGVFEQAERRMIFAGLDYLDDNPGADPQFEWAGGLYVGTNPDGVAMLAAMVAAAAPDHVPSDPAPVPGEATEGDWAMDQVTVDNTLWVADHNWGQYVRTMAHRQSRSPANLSHA